MPTPRALCALAALLPLLVTDLLRANLGPSLRPWQWAATGLALLAGGAWLAERRGGWRAAGPTLALLALLTPALVDHARALESDGVHYYTFLRSALFDADLDLRNDYRLLEADENQKNVLPIGAPILWAPLVVPVHLALRAARLFGAASPVGVEPAYQAAAALATLAWAGLGLVLLQRTLARHFDERTALWTTVLCWVGSPLRFYLSVLPGLAHGVEFFAAVLVLRASLALRAEPSRRRALLAGAACGLVFLTRSQDGLLLGLPGLFLLGKLLRGPGRREMVVLGLLMLAAFAVVALPQLAVWHSMYGMWLMVPHKVIHGEAFMHPEAPRLWETLMSPEGGLLTSYPAMLVAGIGLLMLAGRQPLYVAAVSIVFAAGWYVNSTVFDWWQVRRFTGVVPLLAPGLARALSPLSRAGHLPLALAALLALRYDVAVDALRDRPGAPAPVGAVISRAGEDLARDVYRLLEPSRPGLAVRLLSSYTGERVLDGPMSRIDMGGQPALLRLPLPARNLSAASWEAGEACRWIEDSEARLALPLEVARPLIVTLRLAPLEAEPPTSVEVAWNDWPVGSRALSSGFADYRFHVPGAAVRAGTNELRLRFDRAPIFRRSRGVGPRRPRPAALAVLMLHSE
ncbi:MAG: hypothetical protein AB7O37_12325 [Vicinamibacteria bacterium]